MTNSYLLSYHGFFLEYDADVGIYEQSIISSTKSINRFFCANLDTKEEVLSFREYLKINNDGNFISIGRDDFYVTSLPDGQLIIQYVAQIGAWERFFKISEDFFHKFYIIANENWETPNGIVKKRNIYIKENYIVKFGEYEISVSDFVATFNYDTSSPEECSFWCDGKEIHCRLILNSSIRSIVWVNSLGNIANRALQYLVAKNIAEKSNNVEIANVDLPEWGVQKEEFNCDLGSSCTIGELDFWFDIRGISENLNNGNIDSFIINGYPFNVDFYPSREKSKKYLPNFSDVSKELEGFDEEKIVFNIRADEILHGIHADYLVLPVEYYKMLALKTGLKPVFFGQLDDNPYIRKLKEEFPYALFINGRGPRYDFEVLRRSSNIAISVSTFSWLAAWLSNAKNIYVPLAGMMNPCQAVGQNFIPHDDPVYKFISFPLCRSECLYRHPQRFWEKLNYMAQNMKFVSAYEANQIFQKVDILRNRKKSVGGFDPRFYMKKNYQEISDPGNSLNHYIHSGDVITNAFPIKEHEYLSNYPEAGVEVAKGNFQSVAEYHSFVGYYMGYKNY
ncbi:hypothetical protein NBRC3299_1785 [Acetobacter pasteurianus NBRC 3299]|nr:hypothetical protein BBA71_13950 [Acetobacter pasteurianus]GCD75493.1 hypothetical protein NBRC3299_1785 [Acetobacter pasteurianus NBRC 3299]